MSQLPKGWIEVRAEDICVKVQSGSTPSNSPFTDSGDIPYLKVYNIVNQKIAFDYRKQFISMEIHEKKLARSKVFPNDVLMNIVGPPLGKVAIVTPDYPEWNINQAITLFRTNSEFLLSKFLFYFLNEGSSVKSIHGELKGTVGQVNISLSQCRNFLVPLPPLAEQTQIVEKLDEVLAQVDTIKARLDGIPTILKRFRQSVLAAAVSGKLTEEWRGSPSTSVNQPPITIGNEINDAPKTWTWTKLLDLAKLESGHTPRKSKLEYWDDGDVYWICLQDIRAAHGKIIEDTKFKPTMKGIENSSARLLPKGTVCFSRDISVGYTTIMGKEMSTTQHFANWICGEQLFNKYLMFALMAAKRHLTDNGQGTTVKTIYMPALKEFYLLTPPIDEQKEIVRLVDQYFAFADTIEAQVKKAQTRVDKLTQAILAKAFRGELTADWRAANPDLISGDHSAAALLARIQAERATAKPRKRTTKTSAT